MTLLVAPAEIVGVIGPNGAGKTTLLDLISGFTRADSGGGPARRDRRHPSRAQTGGPASAWAAPSRTQCSSPP